MNKRIPVMFCIILLFSCLSAGRYAGDFMAIGSGVRALSMGGAFSAVADDGSAIYWNASGIAQLKQREATMMRAFLYSGLAYYDNFTFCLPMPNDVTLGFNWMRLSIDNIPIFDEEHLIGTNIDQRSAFEEFHLPATPDGRFDSRDNLFQFAFARHFPLTADLGWNLFELPVDIYAGGSFKLIRRSMYEYVGEGAGFDLSMMARVGLDVFFDVSWLGDLMVSANFQDLGNTRIVWNTDSRHVDEVLFNTKFGIALFQPIRKYQSNLILSYSKDFVYEQVSYYGAAWKYKDLTEFRLGLYDGNFSTGIGIYYHDFILDYAFLTNSLGNTNRIGLGYRF